eukprot:scaffold681_cov173-Ochromonas_danica.AAC.51
MIETDTEDGTVSRTYIRFETFNKMKAWMSDIRNEAQSFALPDEECTDWWTALFSNVPLNESKTHSSHRNGVVVAKADVPNKPTTVTFAPSPSISSEANRKVSSDDGLSMKLASNMRDGGFNASDKLVAPEDSDEDTDSEDSGKPPGELSRNNTPPQESLKRPSANVQLGSKISKKIKSLKQEKPYGPPPFDAATAERYQVGDDRLGALQISLRLCNICGFQDRLFVVVFGSHQSMSALQELSSPQNTTSTPTASKKTVGSAGPGAPGGGLSQTHQSASRWEPLCRTELQTVKQRMSYCESALNEVKIHFNLIEATIPEVYKSIRVVVYRQENDVGTGQDTRGCDYHMQSSIASTVLPRKIFDLRSVLRIKMKVKTQQPMDITVPFVEDPEATLGIVKLCSSDLCTLRSWFSTALNMNPYSERLYSFGANSGMTMSLEQLYASHYSTSTAQALLSLWCTERESSLTMTIKALKELLVSRLKEEENKLRVASTNATGNVSPTEAVPGDDKVAALYEPIRQSIDMLEEIHQEAAMITSLSYTTYEQVSQGLELKNNVIPTEIGGGVLRRSAWKKITAWQYCATNLNVQILSSRFFTFGEILSGEESGANPRNLHFVPTITLGVPSAHELKFHDGGLRKIFGDIPSMEQKLMWMQAIQYPTLELLKSMFENFPKERQALFGSRSNFQSEEELPFLLKRKYELSRRIDICSSQALGCALTFIRTIIMLAAAGSAVYLDILGRSLKIGFLVMFQSMLSTQGAEIGMIEDLEMAALWLSLVSVRLVSEGQNQYLDGLDNIFDLGLDPDILARRLKSALKIEPKATDGKIAFPDQVICRRDVTGRLIVDLKLTVQETLAVQQALDFMHQFEQRSLQTLPEGCGFRFRPNPTVHYKAGEVPPNVLAVVEVLGLSFTQGVNEMQTLANLSSSRDVQKQGEINGTALNRLQNHYEIYRQALDYQLTRYTPDMIEVLASVQPSPPPATDASSGMRYSLSPVPAAGVGGMKRRKSFFRPSLIASPTTSAANSAFADAVAKLRKKILQYNERLLDQLKEAIQISQQNPYEKHVDVLLKSSSICRQMVGCISVLCKSGKDRTSMGVTLEQTRSLVEDLGILNAPEICQLMRQQGVRRMNVYANTGQCMFAFNQIQRRALPMCYRPPPGCHAGNVTS